MGEDPPLPEDPRLRALVEAIEAHGAIGEVLDHKWRIVYITGELCRMMGLSREEAVRLYGITPIIRDRDHADRWGTDRASGALWWTNVAALGDEMNEAARIEGLATDGAILASKPLVERLEVEDAQALGLDPDDLSYTPLGELGATGKALRDAGTIAVAEL